MTLIYLVRAVRLRWPLDWHRDRPHREHHRAVVEAEVPAELDQRLVVEVVVGVVHHFPPSAKAVAVVEEVVVVLEPLGMVVGEEVAVVVEEVTCRLC